MAVLQIAVLQIAAPLVWDLLVAAPQAADGHGDVVEEAVAGAAPGEGVVGAAADHAGHAVVQRPEDGLAGGEDGGPRPLHQLRGKRKADLAHGAGRKPPLAHLRQVVRIVRQGQRVPILGPRPMQPGGGKHTLGQQRFAHNPEAVARIAVPVGQGQREMVVHPISGVRRGGRANLPRCKDIGFQCAFLSH